MKKFTEAEFKERLEAVRKLVKQKQQEDSQKPASSTSCQVSISVAKANAQTQIKKRAMKLMGRKIGKLTIKEELNTDSDDEQELEKEDELQLNKDGKEKTPESSYVFSSIDKHFFEDSKCKHMGCYCWLLL